MEITWLGHSCFRIRTKEATVIMDPYSKMEGLDLGRPKADIVTVSHDHPGHNNVSSIKGGDDLKVITGPGEYEIKGLFITGVRTYHDKQLGKKLGKNTVYLIETEGLVLAHLGDLGHVLDEEQADLMSEVDILLIPVGGGNSLDAEEAVEVISQIEPSIVIPMHYKTAPGQTNLEGIERFCKEMGLTNWQAEEKLVVRKSDFGEQTEVKILGVKAN